MTTISLFLTRFSKFETQRYLEILRANGFTVENGVADIPLAWWASWGSGRLALDVDGERLMSWISLPDAINVMMAWLQDIMERENLPGTVCFDRESLAGHKAARRPF